MQLNSPLTLPDFEVPGQTRTFDLLEWRQQGAPFVRTPLSRALAEMVPSRIQRYLLERAVATQLNELAPTIFSALEGRKAGYLVRINLYADDGGVIFAPSGQIVSALGMGVEPLDALAEAYRAPAIRSARPPGLRDVSSYAWFNRRMFPDSSVHLMGTHIPEALARDFERLGQVEAERREISGMVFITPAPELILQIQRAQHWNQVYQDRVQLVTDLAARSHIDRLNRRLTAAERRFNDAYANYQKIEREMAAHAREMAVLNVIEGVLGAAQQGLEREAQRSRATSERSSKPPMSNENVLIYRETRENALSGLKATLTIEVRASYEDMNKTQRDLEGAWSAAGVPVPAMPRVNIELP